MSCNPTGHVPVGTGQQAPVTNRYNNQQPGQPARGLPARVNDVVHSRDHTVTVVQPNKLQRDVRQVPGKDSTFHVLRSPHLHR